MVLSVPIKPPHENGDNYNTMPSDKYWHYWQLIKANGSNQSQVHVLCLIIVRVTGSTRVHSTF